MRWRDCPITSVLNREIVKRNFRMYRAILKFSFAYREETHSLYERILVCSLQQFGYLCKIASSFTKTKPQEVQRSAIPRFHKFSSKFVVPTYKKQSIKEPLFLKLPDRTLNYSNH
ncbi:hypothetical protein AVEN_144014-1 [Araneus ventricosus]|uniref:Uncharacterized protein n=1 Tax=Araneus ventricosus TaxID=182803 RepID=A0A4Y2LJL1_ARAVE|nr:hypothetical protein AVEN_144014-1 [Araneus ventricosus]